MYRRDEVPFKLVKNYFFEIQQHTSILCTAPPVFLLPMGNCFGSASKRVRRRLPTIRICHPFLFNVALKRPSYISSLLSLSPPPHPLEQTLPQREGGAAPQQVQARRGRERVVCEQSRLLGVPQGLHPDPEKSTSVDPSDPKDAKPTCTPRVARALSPPIAFGTSRGTQRTLTLVARARVCVCVCVVCAVCLPLSLALLPLSIIAGAAGCRFATSIRSERFGFTCTETRYMGIVGGGGGRGGVVWGCSGYGVWDPEGGVARGVGRGGVLFIRPYYLCSHRRIPPCLLVSTPPRPIPTPTTTTHPTIPGPRLQQMFRLDANMTPSPPPTHTHTHTHTHTYPSPAPVPLLPPPILRRPLFLLGGLEVDHFRLPARV